MFERFKRKAAKAKGSEARSSSAASSASVPSRKMQDDAPAFPASGGASPATEQPAAPSSDQPAPARPARMPSYSCVGILSDTHATLPNVVLDIFSGSYPPGAQLYRKRIKRNAASVVAALEPKPCELIVHAGDIGNVRSANSQLIIDALETIAPVIAVLGNNDRIVYTTAKGDVPEWVTFELHGVTFAMMHRPRALREAIRGDGEFQPATIVPAPMVAIHGHTHLRRIRRESDLLTVCPGSTTRPRNEQRPSVMVMYLAEGEVLAIDAIALDEPDDAAENAGE